MSDIVLGIRLKADGSGLVGALRLSREELDKLTGSARKASSETERLNRENSSLANTLNSKLRSAVTGLVAAFSGYKIAQYIKDTANLAARYETLGVVMGVVGGNAGYSHSQMEDFAAGLQKTGISMTESRQTLVQMAQAQIDLTQATQLGRIAQDAAVIGNINSSEAFQRMITGIQSGQVEILRTIGINLSFQQSYEKLADQLGKNATDLTEVEKAQARANAVVEAGARIAGAYEASMTTANKQLGSMARYLEDLQVKLGTVFNKSYTALIFGFNSALQAANKTLDALTKSGQLQEWGTMLANTLSAVGDSFVRALQLAVPYFVLFKGVPFIMLAAAAATRVFTVALLANPFGLAIKALGYVAAGLYVFQDRLVKLQGVTATVSQFISSAWEHTGGLIVGWFKDITTGVDTFSGKAAGAVKFVAQAFTDYFKWIYRQAYWSINNVIALFVALGGSIGRVAAYIVDRYSDAFGKMRDLALSFWDGVKKVFSGDLSFSALQEQFKKGLAPAKSMIADIGEEFKTAFDTDYIAQAATSTANAVGAIWDEIAAGAEKQAQNDAVRKQQLINQAALLIPLQSKLAKATEEGGTAAGKAAKEIENFIAGLIKETETLGMTTEQAKLYDAAHLGMNASQMAVVKGLLAAQVAFKSSRKEMEESKESLDAYIKAQIEAENSYEAQTKAIEEELRALGPYNRQRELGIEIAKLEAENVGWTTDEIYKLAAARVNAKESLASGQKIQAAYKKEREEIKRTAESIRDSLTDALLRGFEAGKGFAKNFRDTLVNMFKTLVLRPTIQGILAPVGGALAGLVPGAANAATGGGMDLSSLLNIGSSLSGIGSSIGSFLGMSGFATGAGSISATGGMVGTSLTGMASAVPWLAIAAIAIPIISSLFDDGPAERTGNFTTGYGGDPNAKRVDTPFGKVGFTDTKWYSDAEMGQALDTFMTSIGQMDTAISSMLKPEQIAEISTNLQNLNSKEYNFGTEHEAINGLIEVMKDRYTVVLTTIDQRLADIFSAFDGPAEQLGEVITGLLQVNQYGKSDPAADSQKLIETANLTLYGAYQRQGVELNKLIANYDGSTDATIKLGQATVARYQAELQMLAQIDAAQKSIAATTASSVEQIKLSNMSDEQKYGYFRAQAEKLNKELAALTDPAQIEAKVKEINSITLQAYNVLPEEKRKLFANQFVSFLEEVDKTANARLAGTKKEIIDNHSAIAGALSDALSAAADKALTDLGEKVAKAVAQGLSKQSEAADKTLQAAGATSASASALSSAASALSNVRINVITPAREVGYG